MMLDCQGTPWGVRWYRVPLASLARTGSEEALQRLEAKALAAAADASGAPPPSSVAAPTTAAAARSGAGAVVVPSSSPQLLRDAALVAIGVSLGMMLMARWRGA